MPLDLTTLPYPGVARPSALAGGLAFPLLLRLVWLLVLQTSVIVLPMVGDNGKLCLFQRDKERAASDSAVCYT